MTNLEWQSKYDADRSCSPETEAQKDITQQYAAVFVHELACALRTSAAAYGHAP